MIATLFFLTGVIERRYGTRDLRELGGMLKGAPSYALVLGLAAFAGMGLPGLIGFWGEFLVLKGDVLQQPALDDGARRHRSTAAAILQIVAILAVFGILTAAVYMINMLQRVLPGEMPVAEGRRRCEALARLPPDGRRRAAVPLAAAIVFFGLYPAPIVNSCVDWANNLWTTYLMF